jgi:hypothetical protein
MLGHEAWWVHEGIKFNIPFSIQVFVQDGTSSLAYPTSFHPFIDSGNFPSGDTRDLEAFNKAANWMERYNREHHSCKTVFQGSRMPKRILFVEDSASLTVRLVDDTDKLSPKPYICLSHRWMPETKASSLTIDRAESFKKQIPKDIFYPLLVDVIEATQQLGFQYL